MPMPDGAIKMVPGFYITVEPERQGGDDGGTTIRGYKAVEVPIELYRGDFFRKIPHAHANPIGGNGGGPRHNLPKPLEEEDRVPWILRTFRDDLRDTLRQGENNGEADAITDEAMNRAIDEVERILSAAAVAA